MTESLLPLTMDDIKTLESMTIVSCREAATLFQIIEFGLAAMYRQSKDYQRLVRQHGKPQADRIVATYTHRVLSHDETYRIGRILKPMSELHTLISQLTDAGTAMKPGTADKDLKEAQMQDALLHDAAQFAWRHAKMCCIPGDKDIQLDSTLKLLATDPTVSPAIFQRLEQWI